MPPRTDPKEIAFPSRTIQCVLAHDHVLLRQGLRRLLDDEPDIEVVSEAGNAAECLRKVYECRPDVVIADTGTFGLAVSEIEMLLSRESPHTKLVFLSMQEQTSSAFEGHTATESCAARQTSVEELVEMVRNACRHKATGQSQWEHHATNHPAMDNETRNSFLRRDPQRTVNTMPSPQRTLTGREREVLKLLAEGKTVRAAATVLGLSSKTVDAHKFNLMRKLGLHNKAELVMWAIQKNFVKIPANF
ncbi:MAG: response regulator transcription factor [Candidatus Sulfotelmatobacter sp.]